MKIQYSSNNSGGSWWLSDDEWRALEADGWTVVWRDERWLGGLATEASRDYPDALTEDEAVARAIRDFERVTKQNADDQGCRCCGQPHYFHKAYEETQS